MFKFKFVDIGEGLHEGVVGEIYVKEGDTVVEGDTLFMVETDKVNSEMPSPVDGIVKKILIAKGETVHVGDDTFYIDDGSADEVEETPTKEIQIDESNASVVGEVKVSNDIKTFGITPAAVSATEAEVEQTNSDKFNINNIKPTGTGTAFDVVVVGAGPAGYKAAVKSAAGGLKVAIIEGHKMGGACVNVGCMPVKAYIKTQKTIKTIKEAEELNVTVSQDGVAVNLESLQVRKNELVEKLSGMVGMVTKGAKVTIFNGHAEFIDQYNIRVNDETLTTKVIVIATGAEPKQINVEGFKAARENNLVVDSTFVLEATKIPKSIVVIGGHDDGGPTIDINFANILNDFGVKVILLKEADSLLDAMDSDVQKFITDLLVKQGVDVQVKVKIIKLEADGTLIYEVDGKKATLKAELILDASGRKPRSQEAIDKLNLTSGVKNEIVVNNQMQTSINNIFAVGDVVGRAMLAHEAYKQADTATKTILGKDSDYKQHMIPKTVYTLPEVATVGYTENELKAMGIEFKVAQFMNEYVGKALADKEPEGFAKIMYEPKYKQVLGAKVIAANAIDIVSQIGLAMELEATIDEIKNTVYPHPATAEII
jgi:dihydrolipoamide dehydrogenase